MLWLKYQTKRESKYCTTNAIYFSTLYHTQKAVHVNPKPQEKNKKPVVGVWKNMTVKELATAMGRDLGKFLSPCVWPEPG